MRIGLLYGLGPQDATDGYASAFAQIDEADRLGLDSVLFEEHHGAFGCPAVAPVVCAAASRTQSIHVGSANRQLTLDHPVGTAEDFAVADLVSGGRVILGVSPGEEPEAFRAAGVPWAERERRFSEAVDLVRAAWTQDQFQFVGEHYQFPLGAQGEPGWRREPCSPPHLEPWRRGQVIPQFLSVMPKPVQLPHPPLWVAAHGRGTIEWAAGRGLTYLCTSIATEDEVRQRVGWYLDALAAAGRSPLEVEVAVEREVFLAADGERAREIALPALRAFIDDKRSASTEDTAGLSLVAGASEQDLLDSCFLVGSPSEVVDRIKALQADLGITHLVCRVHRPGIAHVDVVEAIRLLAAQVATRLAA